MIQSILFFRNSSSTPPVSDLTILSLRAWTWFMSMPTAASPSGEAPFLPVLRDLQRVGVLEQRLGRDAAPVQAGAAERGRALDHGGLQAELRGTNGGDVTAGARANHDDVVFVGHRFSGSRSAGHVRAASTLFRMDDSGTNATVGPVRLGGGASSSAWFGRIQSRHL